jgi:hypothetical protein
MHSGRRRHSEYIGACLSLGFQQPKRERRREEETTMVGAGLLRLRAAPCAARAASGGGAQWARRASPTLLAAARRAAGASTAAPVAAAGGAAAYAAPSSAASAAASAPSSSGRGEVDEEAEAPARLLALLASAGLLSGAGADAAAAAEEVAVRYEGAAGGEFVKNLSGAFYVLLVAYFGYRVLTRRAKRATTDKLSGQGGPSLRSLIPGAEAASAAPPSAVTPINAFIGAAQAGAIAFGLWVFTAKVAASVGSTDLPDAYTARNIAVTVRTILLGLLYLATFIFGANGAGLAGLGVQLLFYPDSLPDAPPPGAADGAAPPGPQLPKVSITADPEEVRRAFDVAERMGRSAGGDGGGSGGSS